MALFLRAHERRKDGKVHTYWSLVENRRCGDGRVVQRQVLYLGALSPSQELSWQKTAQTIDPPPTQPEPLSGLASERELLAKEAAAIAVHLDQFRIERPRQWGACWVAITLWHLLKLSEFWSDRLRQSREGTLIVTPEGYPLAYEVLPGNTSDKTTLKGFLEKIEQLYGKANRVWVMDRGIPTEEVIEQMQQSDPKIHYLVGTPKGRLSRLEAQLVKLPWEQARPSVRVKLLAQEKELYVFVESQDRLQKERAMRRRKLRELVGRLKQLQQFKKKLTRDELLVAVGQAKEQAGRVFKLLEIQWPEEGQEINAQTFRFKLRLSRYRQWYRREGRYLLRTNLTGADPKILWEYYLQLVAIEGAFKNLKDDLAIRPIFHQKEQRIEAHIFVAYLAYCLQVTLQGKLRQLAGGLTARAVLEKFATMQMMDVYFPTEQPGKELVFRRYTQAEKDHQILLSQLGWQLPEQPPPRITVKGELLE